MEILPVCSVGTGSGGGWGADGSGAAGLGAAGGAETGASAWAGCGPAGDKGAGGDTGVALGAGGIPGAAGKAGAVKAPAHIGHFICCPAYCSRMVNLRWQLGQRISMDLTPKAEFTGPAFAA